MTALGNGAKAYTEVIPGRLFIGGHEATKYLKPELHVACAEECPPDPSAAIHCIHFQLDDVDENWLDNPIWCKNVMLTAQLASNFVNRGKIVLITCHLGMNRSGLITALALCYLGMSPDEAIKTLRALRHPDVLSNTSFEKVVKKLGNAKK